MSAKRMPGRLVDGGKGRRCWATIFGVCILPALASSAEQCPEVVHVEAIEIAGLPAEWRVAPSAGFRSSSVGFNNGPPEKRADLKPSGVKDKGPRSVETWQFDRGGFADGLWMVCGYGGDGEIKLAKQISSSYSACQVTYAGKAGRQTIAVACR